MEKKRVLFVCEQNSARSQMAEVFLKQMAGDKFEVESAGFEPGKLDPLAIEAMRKVGVDISQNKTKIVHDFHKQGKRYDYVITVCDESHAQRCPVFPGVKQQLHWSFANPASIPGSFEEQLAKTRTIREQIRHKIKEWLQE
jgi:arsenate reductase